MTHKDLYCKVLDGSTYNTFWIMITAYVNMQPLLASTPKTTNVSQGQIHTQARPVTTRHHYDSLAIFAIALKQNGATK